MLGVCRPLTASTAATCGRLKLHSNNHRQVAKFKTPTILSGEQHRGKHEHIKHTMYDDLQVNIYTHNNEWLR